MLLNSASRSSLPNRSIQACAEMRKQLRYVKNLVRAKNFVESNLSYLLSIKFISTTHGHIQQYSARKWESALTPTSIPRPPWRFQCRNYFHRSIPAAKTSKYPGIEVAFTLLLIHDTPQKYSIWVNPDQNHNLPKVGSYSCKYLLVTKRTARAKIYKQFKLNILKLQKN